MPDGLAGSWFWAGEAAGESHTPAAAGAVDGGAYGHRPLVEGIDVAVLTFPCPTCLGETLDPVFLIGR